MFYLYIHQVSQILIVFNSVDYLAVEKSRCVGEINRNNQG